MRRLTAIALATILVLAVAGPASAHGAGRGFLPPNAKAHGHTLTDLSVEWNIWALGTPGDVNPLLANRCEQSSFDKKIWFMPVSLGGDYEVDCQVPSGAFLVITPGGWFCDIAEAGGSSDAALRSCVVNGFALLTKVEVALDGRAAKHLDRYIVTTPRFELPGPNLLTEDPTSAMNKSYFLIVKPLSRGEHTLRMYDEFGSLDFTAGVTINVTVGRPHHH